ncbi:MAG: L-serine ammonia-lyase, iron-sulfur-dependent, subunit alpha [Pseudomonadota bacterium]
MDHDKIVAILKHKVRPALGCTEPVAVALAAAVAFRQVAGALAAVAIRISPNIFKNGMRVGIPGTRESGIPFAVALALVCGNPDQGLELFDTVDEEAIKAARLILEKNLIHVELDMGPEPFFIEARVLTHTGNARCIIRESHTNIVLVEKNGTTVLDRETRESDPGTCSEPGTGGGEAGDPARKVDRLGDLSIRELIDIIEIIPADRIRFLAQGADMNMAMAEYGLREKSGLGLGAGLKTLMEKGGLADNLINRVRVHTAAATDARMAGVKLPVMSSAGSGNHGITAILPPYLTSLDLGCDADTMVRSLALSHLITIYIKEFTGSLSPVCGCAIAAGIGASASVAWLLGASRDQIAGAIKNMGGDLAGMVCDGAKGGCAFKLSTASGEAILCAMLARNDIIISDRQGIVGIGAESTIRNLGRLCVQGMTNVDRNIIDSMMACSA